MSTPGNRSASQATRISILDSGTEYNRRKSRISFFKLAPGTEFEEVPLLNKTASVLIRPLRVFEFIVLMFLFVHIMYITATDPRLISYFMCIVLVALTGSYLFMSAIDLIAQHSDNRLRVFPNTMFAACGIFFYAIFAIGLLVIKTPTFWLTTMVVALCFIISILYIIDVVLILLFWKRTCTSCDICNHDCSRKYELPEQTHTSNPEPPVRQRAVSIKESAHCQCTLPERTKMDLATSVSDVQVGGANDTGTDHSLRRVSYARRRQYVDSPTNARSAPALDTAQVQTQASATTTIEAQTTRSELQEKTVQTLSKCELCQRQLDMYDPPRSPTPMPPPPPPQAYPACPAFVQLLRGSPYYTGVTQQPTGCRCVAGVVQVQQHGQHQQETALQRGMDQQIELVQCVDPNICGTLTNAETKQLGGPEGTITKVTFCIKSNNKAQCASQTMPYENPCTISPVVSPSASPQSRQSNSNRESPTRRLTSQKSGREDVEREESDHPPLEQLHPSTNKSGGRKLSGDNTAKKLQGESTARRSSGEESGRKSIAKSPIRKSSGEGAVRKSIQESSARDSSCESTKKAAESGPRRSTRQSISKKSEGDTFLVENAARKSSADSEQSRRESVSSATPDAKLLQGRKSDLEINVAPRTSEVTRSKSDIELRAVEKEPSILSLSKMALKGDKEIKLIGCAEGGPCGIITKSVQPEPKIESQRRSTDFYELSETEESSYNPVVQHFEIEEAPLEEWAQKLHTEWQTYRKPIIEETDSFPNPASNERLNETYRKTAIDSESFTKPVSKDKASDAYRKPILEEVEAYQRSLGTTKDTMAQTIESILSPSNKPKKAPLFQRRNKIDPINIIPLEEAESPEYYEQPTHDKFTQEETLFDRRGEDVCPTCHRPKPAPGQNAFHYYHIYRDKRGQIFCETCASPNTVKVVHKQLHSQKRLKCVGCGNFIQYKSVQTRPSMAANESGDVCPTCGRP